MWSVWGFLQSGTPASVKWRDFQRLVALQLSDGVVNKWRAKRGAPALPSGSLRIRLDKVLRLVTVSAQGLVRVVGLGRRGDAGESREQ
jgi:hypothetical protein